MPYDTPSSRWQAVCARDRSANNHFVYAVHTTKCYCRPVCPARLARRANITFFASPAQAEQAGFRACKRCKPDVEAGLEDHVADAVRRAREVMDDWVLRRSKVGDGELSMEGEEKMTLELLAAKVGLTKRYLHKIFKERVGVTPKAYLEGAIERASKDTVARSPITNSPSTASGDSEDLVVPKSIDLPEAGLDGDRKIDMDLDFGDWLVDPDILEDAMLLGPDLVAWDQCFDTAVLY